MSTLTPRIPTIIDVFTKFCAVLSSANSLQAAVTFRTNRAPAVADTRTTWTNAIFNMWIDLGGALGYVSYPERYFYGYGANAFYKDSAKRERGCHMLDLAWTTYPASRQAWLRDLEAQKPLPSPRIILAGECEWGGPAAILDDFAKVVDVKSPLKVMMFSSWPNWDFERLLRMLRTAASPMSADEQLLAIAWPHSCGWASRITQMKARVLTAAHDFDPLATSGVEGLVADSSIGQAP